MEKNPLVYACSGCSLAGCRAYLVAKELEQRGLVDMSCLAGVAARKPSFLKEMEGREVWVIDGCPIECAKGVMDQFRPDHRHISLHDHGVPKDKPAEVATADLVDRLLEGQPV